MMHIRDYDVGIYRRFGLEGDRKGRSKRIDRTYVEDLKDSHEVLFPSGIRILIGLRVRV